MDKLENIISGISCLLDYSKRKICIIGMFIIVCLIIYSISDTFSVSYDIDNDKYNYVYPNVCKK